MSTPVNALPVYNDGELSTFNTANGTFCPPKPLAVKAGDVIASRYVDGKPQLQIVTEAEYARLNGELPEDGWVETQPC